MAALQTTPARRRAHPIPRFDRGVSRRRLLHPVPGLADDLDFVGRGMWGRDDVDVEQELFTWPETMDQTQIGQWSSSPLCHDDAEDDDPDHGIEDLPHDPRDEDGA